jgi:hypothetical protein
MAKRKVSAKPTQPPSGADMSALITRLNLLTTRVNALDTTNPDIAALLSKLPEWKRWVGGEGPDYDIKGLRDVVNANALYADQIKGDVDVLAQRQIEMMADIRALQEAPAARPFP